MSANPVSSPLSKMLINSRQMNLELLERLRLLSQAQVVVLLECLHECEGHPYQIVATLPEERRALPQADEIMQLASLACELDAPKLIAPGKGKGAKLLKKLERGLSIVAPLCIDAACVGAFLLLDIPDRDCGKRAVKEVSVIAPVMALAFRNALLFDEQRKIIAERTQELEVSERKYRELFEKSKDAILIIEDGIFVECNQAAVEMLGYENKAQILSQHPAKLSPEKQPDGQPSLAKANEMMAIAVEKGSHRFEWRHKKASGEIFPVEVLLTAISVDEEHQVLHTVWRDITERARVAKLQKTLYRLSQAANQSAKLSEFYKSIHDIICQVMPADNLYIALYDEKKKQLYAGYHVDQMDSAEVTLAPGRGLTAYVLRTKKTLLCDADQFAQLVACGEVEVIGTPPQVWLGVPLIVENNVVGVITVQDYYDRNAYGAHEEHLLEYISSPLASMVTRQLARAETLKYARVNELLYKAGQQLSESLDPHALYLNLYNLVAEVMDCQTFVVSSYDAETASIHCDFICRQGREQDARLLPAIPLEPEGQGTESLVIRSGEALIVDDIAARRSAADKAYYIDDDGNIGDYRDLPEDAPKEKSLLAAPLKRSGKVVGVVQVMSDQCGAYTQDNLAFLEALSAQISLSVNNARLYQQAQKEIQQRINAERELKTVNIALEEMVKYRTAQLEERVEAMEALNRGMANVLSDLNAANAVARENARNLEQANIELEAFSYSVSHDLRAPLRHVDSFARLLQQRIAEALDETSRRYLENILDSTQKMSRLIDDLLALSRTTRVDLRYKPVDFNAVVESARAQLFDLTEGRNIVWKIADLPALKADTGLMKVVWTNLLSNAVKYTRPRKKAVIEIGAIFDDDNRQITFFVRDNGVGFDPQYGDKIFGVFQRLHRSDQFEGTGVGLATVQRIVRRHGGEVWAEGEPDRGAVFYFSLPDDNGAH